MSTWLRKTKDVPGGAGGYVWNTTEDIVEVEDDWLAGDLLDIPDAGFVSVAAPERDGESGGDSGEEPAPDAGADAPQEPEAEKAPAKPARKTAASKAAAKTPVQE
jgi:hypothetical protein